MVKTWAQSLGWEYPLEKEMATHSSFFTWKVPWIKETGRLRSQRSQRVGPNWLTFTFTTYLEIKHSKTRKRYLLSHKEKQSTDYKGPSKPLWPTPVFVPGESQGRGAWWAAVYGVTLSRTRLKRFSSSSSSSSSLTEMGNHGRVTRNEQNQTDLGLSIASCPYSSLNSTMGIKIVTLIA